MALVALALIPLAEEMAALATLGILAALLVALIVYESIRFAELRINCATRWPTTDDAVRLRDRDAPAARVAALLSLCVDLAENRDRGRLAR